LKFRGFNVIFVRNITDIDDKIIDRAIETKRTAHDVSEEQIRFYYEDFKALGIPRVMWNPRPRIISRT
jgi:cysteinyl-tRNA synthetase